MRNWAGNITFGAARVHRPRSVAEAAAIVAGADRVRVLGTGHSFNRIADTDGDLLRLDALPHRVAVDPESSTVDITGGMRYAEVAAALHAQGYALGNLASLPHISVAGAVATGTHGSGLGNPSLAAAVRGLSMIGPDGETRWYDGDPAGAVVSLGALGVVVGLRLAVEPTYDVAQRVVDDVPLAAVAADPGAVFGAGYSVSVFTGWRGTAMVWVKRRLDTDPAVRLGDRWLGGRPADGPRHPIAGMAPDSTTTQLDVPGPWHERLPHFAPGYTPSAGDELQSELLLPYECAGAAIDALAAVGDRIAPALAVCEIRVVAADSLWLSPAYGRDSLALHFTWRPDRTVIDPALSIVEGALAPFGPRPHWAKLTTMPPRRIVATYPRAADFAALLRHADPAGKFRNRFVSDLFPV
ncbi:MAG TPA: FAD-binding protein [Actinocatenispora sp.]